jgi:iron complex transport system ATP-binding protein
MSRVAVSRLTVRYGPRLAVDSVTLTVELGEWVALIGPNGAGKTSVLRALAGTVAYGGRIEIGGVAAASLPRRQAARLVALVPQQPTLPDGMKVLDYVLLGRTPHLGYLAAESDADVAVAREALARLDGTDLETRRLGELSGGERQRVVLSRALTQESSVLLLDEPTAALDVGHGQQVLDLVDELRRERGMSVIAAVHDLTLAAQYSDRLALMDQGQIVAEGSPRDVLTEESIQRFSGARVSIVTGPGGEVVVVPRR